MDMESHNGNIIMTMEAIQIYTLWMRINDFIIMNDIFDQVFSESVVVFTKLEFYYY